MSLQTFLLYFLISIVDVALVMAYKDGLLWSMLFNSVPNDEQKFLYMTSRFSDKQIDLQFIVPTSREKAFLEYFFIKQFF